MQYPYQNSELHFQKKFKKESAKEWGFYQPAEWESHEAVWLAWPSHPHLWQENLGPAQEEFIGLCEAIARLPSQSPIYTDRSLSRGERLHILVPSLDSAVEVEKRMRHLPHRIFNIPFGDIWLRDTSPIFLKRQNQVAAACFAFNSWGHKYDLPDDPEVSARIALAAEVPVFQYPWVLEGGSIEGDGEGTCLTTRQCLLNPNRNPGLSVAEIERSLEESMGFKKILWLNEGLCNDHTDGHIDTIARFVGPGKVLCMQSQGSSDPNHDVLNQIAKDLKEMEDFKGRRLQVGLVPSPGEVLSQDGELMPASYLNFYIANSTVVVPTYGSSQDADAVAVIASWFPERKTVGVPAKSILTGGGAFHCITQQQPSKESSV